MWNKKLVLIYLQLCTGEQVMDKWEMQYENDSIWITGSRSKFFQVQQSSKVLKEEKVEQKGKKYFRAKRLITIIIRFSV